MSGSTQTMMRLEDRVEARVGLNARGRKGLLVGAPCPFHGEGEVIIDVAAQRWTCPVCAPDGATEVAWVMKVESVSKRRAMAIVKAGAQRLPRLFEGNESDKEIAEKVVGLYRERLAAAEEVRAWLGARHIKADAIAAHGVGYADGTLNLRVPPRWRKDGTRLRDELAALGVCRRDGYEALAGSVVIPLTDREGALAELVGVHVQRGGVVHVRLGEKRGLLRGRKVEGAEEVVIAATALEALTWVSLGVEHVIGIGEERAWETVVDAVKASGAKRAVLGLPRDTSPVTAPLAGALAAAGLEVLRMMLPQGESAHDVVRGQDGEYRLKELYRLAEWVGGVGRASAGAAPRAALVKPVEPPRVEAEPASELGHVYTMADRRWRIRGLAENVARGVLRVNVFVSREDVGFHVDTFDLYSARHRTAFVSQAASELRCEDALVKKDLGLVLLKLEQAQEEAITKREAPKVAAAEMTTIEREQALELLRDPKLMDKVLGAFEAMGIVGEKENLLAGYLVGVSRKLKAPLAMVIQSSSAAGKTAVLDAIVSLVPEEDRFNYSAISGQSLYYMGERSLRHRVLSIAEHTGAEKASYALKLLQSSKALTIASTGKDAATGRITSQEYKVEGPVALMVTTTKVELDEELQNRCLVVTIDESPEQTRAVHEAQRRAQTLAGIERETRRAELERLHQNAQRLLRPLVVVNPYADEIHFGDRRVRARRDHRKLLSLIEAIALVHQHQRPSLQHVIGEHPSERIVEYIEATREDVERAEALLEALVGSVAEDVPPRTRELLSLLSRYVSRHAGSEDEQTRRLTFSRREARAALGWGDTQLKIHLRRLVDAELVIMRRAPHGGGVVYELAFDAQELEAAAETGERAAVGRAEVGAEAGPGRGGEIAEISPNESGSDDERSGLENSRPGVVSSPARAASTRRAS